MLSRWKAGVGKISQDGALGLGISIVGRGHGVRESEVVFRMYSKLGKNLYLLSLGPAEGDEGKLDSFFLSFLGLLLQQSIVHLFLG